MDPTILSELIQCARYGELEEVKQYFSSSDAPQLSLYLTQQDEKGNTMLHMASANGHIDFVDYILQEMKHTESNINCVNEEGNSALHWAVMNGHESVIEKLLDNGADGKLLNAMGHSSLYYAEMYSRQNISELILKYTDFEPDEDDEEASPDTEEQIIMTEKDLAQMKLQDEPIKESLSR